jgi:predicted negative regulator of RcsB-dependent stress response
LTLWTWFEANRKAVMTVAGIIVVVVLIGGFFYWRQQQNSLRASEALTDLLISGYLQRNPQATSADKLLQLASEHTGTSASARALFQAATVLFVDGKYAEAQTQFQRFVTENGDHSFVPQAMYGIATCLEAQGKPDEAAKSYKNISDRFKATGLGVSAMCSLGRILESQGKLAEALPLFEEVVRTDPSGMLGGEARIRVAEIQQKLPPPPVAPAPSVSPTPTLISTNTP